MNNRGQDTIIRMNPWRFKAHSSLNILVSLSKQVFYCFSDFHQTVIRVKIMDYFSLRVKQKFAKIPWNLFCFVDLWVVERWVGSEIAEDRISLRSVDLTFGKKWKFWVKMFFHIFLDIGIRSIFLTQELIAGEGQQLEAFPRKLFVHLRESCVIDFCESSITSHINNEDWFVAFEYCKVDHSAPDVWKFEIEEGLGDVSRDRLEDTMGEG